MSQNYIGRIQDNAVVRRLFVSAIVLWLAYTISFFLLYVLPGDAALARLSGDGGDPALITPERIEELREQLGLADPIWVQYVSRLGNLLIGDFGNSLRNDQPVLRVIGDALPATLQLAGLALLMAIVSGSFLAVLSNVSPYRWLRNLSLILPSVGIGLPTFWFGIILISVLSFGFNLLPAGGNFGFSSLIMPAITLAIGPASVIAQVFGKSLHDAIRQPYAETTAPAKGAGRRRVVLLHCIRNAVIPTLTVTGVIVGYLMSGSVVVETVFSRSGVGRVMLDAVQNVDLTVVQGVVVLNAAIYVVINLAVDLAYPLIDPRLGSHRSTAQGDA